MEGVGWGSRSSVQVKGGGRAGGRVATSFPQPCSSASNPSRKSFSLLSLGCHGSVQASPPQFLGARLLSEAEEQGTRDKVAT